MRRDYKISLLILDAVSLNVLSSLEFTALIFSCSKIVFTHCITFHSARLNLKPLTEKPTAESLLVGNANFSSNSVSRALLPTYRGHRFLSNQFSSGNTQRVHLRLTVEASFQSSFLRADRGGYGYRLG